MDDQALNVSNVCQQREDLQLVDKLECCFLAALDIKGEDRCAAVREVLLVQSMIRVVRQRRMVHMLNLRVIGQELNDLLGVLNVTLDTQRQSLSALQQQKCVERRNGSTSITQQDSADVGYESSRTNCICKRDAVITRVRLSDRCILAGCLPVELAGINNDAAEGRAVAADELGSRVNNDISAVLNRTDKVRGTESVVDYERQTVLVRNLCDSLDIRNIGIRVAESLDVNRLSIVLDSAFQFFQIVCINEGGLNAELRQSMCQQVVAAAVDGLLCYDVVASLSKCLNGVGNRCGAGSGSQSGNTALECCNALLEHILRGVSQTAVNIACIRQTETVSCVLAVVENIRGGLVDRNCTGIGNRVSGFLTDVQLLGFKGPVFGILDSCHDELSPFYTFHKVVCDLL